ncbi:MAG: c-type cytochrome biogenesis protein CcmI [Pseudomonadota bacterium]
MLFWIIACLVAIAAALVVSAPLLRRGEVAPPRASHDAQVFRDQLKELERDVARGVVTEEDAETTRLEISRRLLAADSESRAGGVSDAAPAGVSRGLAALLIIAAPAASLWLYNEMGSPGAEDPPFAARGETGRPGQEEAEQMMAGRELAPPAEGEDAEQFRKLVTQLEARLAEAPDDAQGLFLYARSLMNLGRFSEAWRQFKRLTEVDEKASADIYAGYAEAMILAAGGYISPEAEAGLLQVLKREPTNPSARYYLGQLHAQAGDPELAESVWLSLLETSPGDAPWVAPIRAELAELGLGPRSTDGLPGPTPEEVQAAASLSEAERKAMANDMVERLATRIAENGGSVPEWRMLIRSYSSSGQPQKAQEALAAAREAYAGDPAALAALESDAAAQRPGAGPGAPQQRPGPSSDDIAAAADMAPRDRAAMIESMVARLAERLQTEGGTPEDWLRLISSLGVMGRAEEASAAYAGARAAFANDPRALALLESAVEGAPRAAAAPTRGPSEEDIAAAQELTPDERQEQIRAMVAGLHERLREEGRAADVNEWGQLMRSYRVLGQNDAVKGVYDEASAIFDDDSIALAYLKEAALLNGVEF